jgi:uncharacterized protein (DUF924 family)
MAEEHVDDPATVLDFWFAPETRERWFKPTPEFDAEMRHRFGALYEAARDGKLAAWENRPEGALALLILLDQAPRNMFRDDARAFATDEAARAVARRAVAAGHDLASEPDRRVFFYLPFEHSEDIEDQHRSVALVKERADIGDYLEYAERHLAVIARFGRFPHRNALLGREPTPEERDYLAGRDTPF